ncbi:hypothetical protein K2V52_10870 [Staphylococcus nepalensis]|uniref:hypothetical protein n=1 Tax=Staphylococcus nepalensis TaxID=214473 RepID=UPI001E3B963E|nr:hypothetical protein [Staphylococcus nepalensis]MCD8892471.1 hypothetical protein [Staphylococcus nepalensis]
MKKVLFLLLASFLVLAACGDNEESKSEDKKETKSSSKESKKKDENKKSNNDKKSNDDKKTNNEKDKFEEQVATQDESTQTQEQEPTDQEKMEANAKVAKEHGFTGIPNGDVGMIDENYSPEDDSEQTYDYENNGVQRTPSEQKAHEDWVNGQDEWLNASESEREEIRKADAEKYGYKYDPSDYEE